MPTISNDVVVGNYVSALTPQPEGSLGGNYAGGVYTYYTEDDLYSADIPAFLGTNINSVARVVPPKAIGITFHDSLNPPSSIGISVARNHDLNGGMWHTIETSLGVYNWTRLDAWADWCHASGIDMIFVYAGTPVFRSARPTEAGVYGVGTAAEPATLQDVADFMAMVASRYLARGTPIKYFEVGNEAKYGIGAASYFSGTPATLATMTRLISIAVKAVDPTATILSMSPTGCELAWVLNDNSGSDYLHKMLSASDGAGGTGADWVDAIAFHGYSHTGFNNLFSLPQQVANMRAVLAANGMSASMPLWITEISAITPPYNTQSIKDRKDYLSRSLVLALASGVERIVWYSDSTSLGGFSADAELREHWNYMRGLLEGATLGVVNHSPPVSMGTWNNNGKWYGKVYAVINGVRHAF